MFSYNKNDDENNPIVTKSNVNFNMIFIINIALGIAVIIFSIVNIQISILTSFSLFNKLDKLILPFIIIGSLLIYYCYKKGIGDLKTHIKLFFWWLLVIIIIIGFNMYNIINPSTRYGKMDYATIENIKIPTIYKYTKCDGVFSTIYIRNTRSEDLVGSYLTVFYLEKIPKDYTNYYKDELIKLGYKKVKHNGNELYVQNNLNDSSFQYIYIGDLQISYGVCTSGYYEDILK